MEVRGSTMGVPWEYNGSTWKYHGSTMEIPWKYVEVRWEYSGSMMGVRWEYSGSTMEVQWEHNGSIGLKILLYSPCTSFILPSYFHRTPMVLLLYSQRTSTYSHVLPNFLEVESLSLFPPCITFLVGFIGNTASLLTFSQPTLRKVSTGCLFITLTVSDMSYLLICVIDFVEFGLQVEIHS